MVWIIVSLLDETLNNIKSTVAALGLILTDRSSKRNLHTRYIASSWVFLDIKTMWS